MTNLNDLFNAADSIGDKYLTDAERTAYRAKLDAVHADIDHIIDERNEQRAAEEGKPKGSFAALKAIMAETDDIVTALEPHQSFAVEQMIRGGEGSDAIRPIQRGVTNSVFGDLRHWLETNALEDAYRIE